MDIGVVLLALGNSIGLGVVFVDVVGLLSVAQPSEPQDGSVTTTGQSVCFGE